LPLFVGAFCAKGDLGAFWPLLGAVFFGFLALTPARIIYKAKKKGQAVETNVAFWSVVYCVFAVALAGHLALFRPLLIPVFALMGGGFYLGVRASHGGFQRNAWFEFGGLAALSLGSLLGAFTVSGHVGLAEIGVWLLALLFMLDRSVESRRVVRLGGFLPVIARQEPLLMGRLKPVFLTNLGISFMTLLFALSIAEKTGLNLLLALPFVPGFFVTLVFWLRLPSSLSVLGYTELFLSIFYGVAFPAIFNLYT
jgi:hypothetical protein